ncbi:transposase family protein [Streptomyces sp. NPDC053427]|uniref:transposase family protein n=1 Tax=Streptomyces sp. NPDC053427 TaxID=3365701 RepID=UPI0037D1AEEC
MNDVLPQLNELLFSSVEGVLVESVEVIDTVVRVEARTTAGRAAGPGCGCWSGRIHRSYLRFPRDLPTAGTFVVVSLRVRRFVCEEESCERMTFAEQVPGLTRRFGRRTERLRSTLVSVGLAGPRSAGVGTRRSLASRGTLVKRPVVGAGDRAGARAARRAGIDPGHPLGANRHDSPLLGPTPAAAKEQAGAMPETVNLDRGYDSAKYLAATLVTLHILIRRAIRLYRWDGRPNTPRAK